MIDFSQIQKTDKEIYDLIIAEYDRQSKGLEMIASENRPSEAVLLAQASRAYFKICRRISRT